VAGEGGGGGAGIILGGISQLVKQWFFPPKHSPRSEFTRFVREHGRLPQPGPAASEGQYDPRLVFPAGSAALARQMQRYDAEVRRRSPGVFHPGTRGPLRIPGWPQATPGTSAPAPAPAPPAAVPAMPGSVLYSQQPGTPQPPGSPAVDWIDAITRGLAKGLQLRDLVLMLIDLFRKPRGSGTETFWFPGGPGMDLPATPSEVTPLPYLMAPTGSIGAGSSIFGTDLFGGLGGLAGGIASIIQQVRGTSSVMPGGMRFAGISGGDVARAVGVSPSDCPNLFRSSLGTTARPVPRIIQQNPVTGNLAVWEYAGHPILMSRDKIVAKRYAKICGGHRRPRFR
jgi:hypothetical protein